MLKELAKIYINKVVKLHGILVFVVSYKGIKFTLHLWKSMHCVFETKMCRITTFCYQIDSQMERVNQLLEEMLKACMLDFKGGWDAHIPLIEFEYNYNF